MFGGFKKALFLIMSMGYSLPVLAQSIDDIPLFEEVNTPLYEEKSSSSPSSVKEASPSLVISPKAEEKKTEEKKPEPNIGRKAIPLDELIVTPDPLPEVSIPLNDKGGTSESQPQPVVPVNTRQEGIYIPPTDKTGTVVTQSTNLTALHDVHQFDISGFYLGITPQAVLELAEKKGYFVSKMKKAIPLFQTTYYNDLCRQSGIYAPDMVRSCIRQHAQENKQAYVEEIILTKKKTKESFHFTFTSPATGNEAYQIIYQNKGDNSLNFMPTNLAKKLSRKEAFFNAVFEMYGYPDDPNELIWGTKEDAYMQVSMMGSAYDATIKLVDSQLSNEDYFEATDWKADKEPLYHFGFTE